MHAPENFTRVIERKRYSTATATLIASDAYWDGHNFERRGRNQFLYRTPRGAYFTVTLTQWNNERDTLEPVDIDQAIELYEGPLSEHEVSYEQAFPGVEVLDA